MITLGYITKNGSVLIIGTSEEEVEDAFKTRDLSKSHIESQHLYPFQHENNKTTLGNAGTLSQHIGTIQKEVAEIERFTLTVYPDRIEEFLDSL